MVEPLGSRVRMRVVYLLSPSSSSMVVMMTCSISWASCSSVLMCQPWALAHKYTVGAFLVL